MVLVDELGLGRRGADGMRWSDIWRLRQDCDTTAPGLNVYMKISITLNI